MNQMTLQDQWLFQKEKNLAWFRAGFAAIAIAVIQLNPARVDRFPLLSRVVLACFLLYSLGILYATLRRTGNSQILGLVAICFDLIWVSVIIFSTGGASTPFFVYYFFPVITAGSLYGIKGGISAALAGIGIYGFIRFTFDWPDSIGIDRFIVRSIYLVFLAYIFGVLSEFEKNQNQRLLAFSKTAGKWATLEERRRITQEVHDGLLQALATQILRIERCRKLFLDSPQDTDRELRSIEDDTRRSMKVIRQFLAGEATQPVPPGMLLEKLKEDLRFLRDGLGLTIVLEAEPEDFSIPIEMEKDIFYVLKEGLMNVVRHSHASRAEIVLRRTNTQVHGMLSDDGIGFNPALETNRNGLGLNTMKERIEGLGGGMSIYSSPGKGTKISFELALSSPI